MLKSHPSQETNSDLTREINEWTSNTQRLKRLQEDKDTILQKLETLNNNMDNDSGTETDNEDNNDVVPCYGNVELTPEELKLLQLGLDYMLNEQLSLCDLEIESQISMTKSRWTRQSREENDENDDEDANAEDEGIDDEMKDGLEREL